MGTEKLSIDIELADLVNNLEAELTAAKFEITALRDIIKREMIVANDCKQEINRLRRLVEIKPGLLLLLVKLSKGDFDVAQCKEEASKLLEELATYGSIV